MLAGGGSSPPPLLLLAETYVHADPCDDENSLSEYSGLSKSSESEDQPGSLVPPVTETAAVPPLSPICQTSLSLLRFTPMLVSGTSTRSYCSFRRDTLQGWQGRKEGIAQDRKALKRPTDTPKSKRASRRVSARDLLLTPEWFFPGTARPLFLSPQPLAARVREPFFFVCRWFLAPVDDGHTDRRAGAAGTSVGIGSSILKMAATASNYQYQNNGQRQHLYNPQRSTAYIVILTLIVGALQLAWSTEFSEATPFLLSLGISKRVLSLVWLAGPLSGTIGQPIVGMLSDKCMLSYGKRRVFILIGCISTSVSLLALSHSSELVGLFTSPFDWDDRTTELAVICFACVGIYVLDFSIAIIQASSRALIVDVVPTGQQQIANAWAARMIGIFNLIGFWIGTLNLTELFPVLGDNQFKILSTLVVLIMFSLTCFCLYYVEERNPQSDLTLITQRQLQDDKLRELGINPSKASIWVQLKNFFKQIFYSFKSVPPQVKTVCYAQLFAWIGYFPLLFYTTSYVGELYLYEKGYPNPALIPPELKQDLLDQSTRVGTYALLSNSIVTLAVVTFLPMLLERIGTRSTFNEKLNLRTLWICSHVVFILCTLCTFFISSYKQAIALFAFTGIPWGGAVWIPFTLISEEISRIKDIIAIQIFYRQQSEGSSIAEDDAPEINSRNSIYCQKILIDFYDNIEYDSGILLALHNVFVSAPQMLSSFASSILFSIFHKAHDDNSYDSSLGWVFRFGGVMAIGAWYISRKVKTKEELYDMDRLMALSIDF